MTYYVDINAGPGGDGSQGNPWDAFADATATVVAGDTVRVQGGTYTEAITETTDGTLNSPIVYVADGLVTVTNLVTLPGDYIKWIGFSHDRNLAGNDCIDLGGTTGTEIWNCKFRECLRQAVGQDANKTTVGNKCVIIGNEFFATNGTAGVSGESRHIQIRGNDNLVGWNVFNGANEDFIYWFGARNSIRNNYGYNSNSDSGAHVDFIQTGTDAGVGNTFTTFEANFYVDADVASDHHHVSNMSNSGTDFTNVLMRRNILHQVGTGFHNIFENWTNVYMVHEDFLESNRFDTTTRYGIFVHTSVENPRMRNCIAVQAWGTGVTTNIEVMLMEGSGQDADFNLANPLTGTVTYAGDWSGQANELSNMAPGFVNYGADDFTLAGGSAAIGAASWLTLVNETAGTGTTLTLDDAGYFRGVNSNLDMYGGALSVGDKITVGTDQVTIVSISGNDITVTPSFTWADNDPVYLGWDVTPDLGAYPANYVPLTSAAIRQNGDDYTVTPNGDTAFVVFFVDGIPYTVVNSSPYTATISSGVVTARAYALYAQKQPVIDATLEAAISVLTVANLIIG